MSTNLRICCVTTSYPRTPHDEAGIFVERLVGALVESGVRCTVVTPLDTDELLREQRGHVAIQRFRYGILRRGSLAFGKGIGPNVRANPLLILQAPGMIFQFAAQIWKMNHQVDVVHANWLLAGCAAYLARILGGRPYIVTCRGEDLKLLELPVVSIFLKIILRKATFVTTVSLQFRDQILRHIPDRAGQVVCIPNGVTGPSEDEVAPLSQRPKTLLYVGRVIPLKRLEWAVNLLSSPELEDYELIVCGRAEDEAYRQKLVSEAQDRGVAGRIRFAGVVPPSEIGRYLERARYFINFSEYEGRPNSVLEALAYGLVVLASDITAHREVLENGRNGMLCTSPEEGAAVIQQLDRDPELYDRISHEARRSVQPYTWEAAADAYSQIFARATISS